MSILHHETELVSAAAELSRKIGRLRFSAPVHTVYNPLDYAWEAHATYLRRYGGAPKEVVLVGMNPGPWGMAQTGVPFGEVEVVRDWLGIDAEVSKPRREHPKRPVDGFQCRRSEVSGRRLWGWAREAFGTPERFFSRFFIGNYCPLSFMEESGRNRTPDKLPAVERARLFEYCDRALRRAIAALEPRWVVGVGRFAEGRARAALEGLDVEVGRILHPSPANPAANRNWQEAAVADLRRLGVSL